MQASIQLYAQGSTPFYPMTPSQGDVLLATPEVSAMQKHNFNSVNLYTGKINLSIPIYEIKTGNIVVPIELTYNSGGIKVDEVATSVGIGWNLSAGGSVLRTIKDLEDNDVEFSPNTLTTSWSPGGTQPNPERKTYVSQKGYLADYSDLNGIFPSLSMPPGTGTHIDASPDLFLVSAPGLSTKFFLNNLDRGNPQLFNDNISTYTIKFIDGSGNKGLPVTRKRLTDVLPSNGFGFSYNLKPVDYEKFSLFNTKGIKYSFGSVDVSESLPNYYSPTMFIPKEDETWGIIYYSSTAVYDQFFARGMYRLRASAWNLDKIEDPQTNRTVLYEYEKYNRPDEFTYRTNIQTALLSNAMPFPGGNDPYPNNGKCVYKFIADYVTPPLPSDPPTPDECMVKNSHLKIKYPQNNRIKEITWEGGKVKFYYDLTRQDALNEKALTKIEIIVNSAITETYVFNYSYLSSKENCSDWNCKRLKLESVDVKKGLQNQFERYYTLEYYDQVPLPKVNSLQQDFLGYYNNHGVELEPINMHIHPQIQKTPKLYFNRMGGKNAIRPFPLGFAEYIPGDYSLEANEYSLTGLLKKIKNPLGGFAEFEYENHDFIFESSGIKAGGARIKTQILNDGNKERYIYYKYQYGKLINLPTFGYPLGIDRVRYAQPNSTSFVTYTTNRGDVQLTNGSYIGYTKVIEQEEGKGYTVYEFSNVDNEDVVHNNPVPDYYTCETLLHKNSSYGNNFFIDNDIMRGKVLSEKKYDVNNKLVATIDNFYEKDVFEEITLPFKLPLYVNFSFITDPNAPYIPQVQEYRFTNKLRVERNLIRRKSISTIYDNNSVSSFEDKYQYDPIYPFVKSKKRTVLGGYSINEMQFTYPHEYGNQLLTDANILENPTTVEKKFTEKNSFLDTGTTKLISKESITFAKNNSTSNLIQPVAIASYNMESNIPETNLSYDKYDNKGNLIQYTPKNGIPTVIIWGYNQTLPIAKVEGISYENLMQAFGITPSDNIAYLNLDIVQKSNLDIDDASELQLSTALNTFKSNSNLVSSKVLTYTHNPGIGMTSSSEINGLKNLYEYNNKNKLHKVLNSEGKTIKEFNYNFTPTKPQSIFYNRKKEQLFSRNNCQAGYMGENYNYIVPAGKHSSPTSLADANLMAENDILSNGQNMANTNAPCTATSCPFTPESGLNILNASIQKLSTVSVQANINIPISSNSAVNWQGFMLGTVGGSCTLQTQQNWLVTSENGRTWRVLMSSSGGLFLQLLSGNVSSGTINLSFQYNTNDSNVL